MGSAISIMLAISYVDATPKFKGSQGILGFGKCATYRCGNEARQTLFYKSTNALGWQNIGDDIYDGLDSHLTKAKVTKQMAKVRNNEATGNDAKYQCQEKYTFSGRRPTTSIICTRDTTSRGFLKKKGTFKCDCKEDKTGRSSLEGNMYDQYADADSSDDEWGGSDDKDGRVKIQARDAFATHRDMSNRYDDADSSDDEDGDNWNEVNAFGTYQQGGGRGTHQQRGGRNAFVTLQQKGGRNARGAQQQRRRERSRSKVNTRAAFATHQQGGGRGNEPARRRLEV